jgi:hypothetical protein
VWRQHARALVQKRALNSGYYLAEQQPEEVQQELLRFFTNCEGTMKSRQIDQSPKTFILVFKTGDELAKGLLEFAE